MGDVSCKRSPARAPADDEQRLHVVPAFAQPAQVVPQDVWITCISAFLICSVAALIPAYFAARLDPVKALRYE